MLHRGSLVSQSHREMLTEPQTTRLKVTDKNPAVIYRSSEATFAEQGSAGPLFGETQGGLSDSPASHHSTFLPHKQKPWVLGALPVKLCFQQRKHPYPGHSSPIPHPGDSSPSPTQDTAPHPPTQGTAPHPPTPPIQLLDPCSSVSVTENSRVLQPDQSQAQCLSRQTRDSCPAF